MAVKGIESHIEEFKFSWNGLQGCKQITDMWLKSYRVAQAFPTLGRTLHRRRLEQESRHLWDHIESEDVVSDDAEKP